MEFMVNMNLIYKVFLLTARTTPNILGYWKLFRGLIGSRLKEASRASQALADGPDQQSGIDYS